MSESCCSYQQKHGRLPVWCWSFGQHSLISEVLSSLFSILFQFKTFKTTKNNYQNTEFVAHPASSSSELFYNVPWHPLPPHPPLGGQFARWFGALSSMSKSVSTALPRIRGGGAPATSDSNWFPRPMLTFAKFKCSSELFRIVALNALTWPGCVVIFKIAASAAGATRPTGQKYSAMMDRRRLQLTHHNEP